MQEYILKIALKNDCRIRKRILVQQLFSYRITHVQSSLLQILHLLHSGENC